uniref:forkhead box protein R1 n=1 Tax=Jaculus jaculus TaxID=51337 RepID=UPI001E1B5502|nr:forkhead box protein R1 [Jaculus jaculus]
MTVQWLVLCIVGSGGPCQRGSGSASHTRPPAALPGSPTLGRLSSNVDLQLQDPDFWNSLHGQVPGLLDWDLGNEALLACTTSHLPLWEQNLAKYKLQIIEPPKLPLKKKPNADKDGPAIEPNPWMWVNPNIVYPPGKLEVKERKVEGLPSTRLSRQPLLKKEEASSSDTSQARSLLPSSSEQPLAWKRKELKQKQPRKRSASCPSSWELTEEEEEEAKDQDDSSSVALPSPHTRVPLQSRRLLRQAISPEGRLWSRPPLNYFHLIALALRNSPPCGLNVQQIYSFTRQHFPFFQTAPEGWKNTVRHNLCFRDSFEKVPVSMQREASTQPRSCLWKLTEEGHRRFVEEARALASTQLESIQQSMSHPDVMPFLFDIHL